MPEMSHYLSITVTSASLDADEIYLVPDAPAVRRACAALATFSEEAGDGGCEAYLCRLPGIPILDQMTTAFFQYAACSVLQEPDQQAVVDQIAAWAADTGPVPAYVECFYFDEVSGFWCTLDTKQSIEAQAASVLAAWLMKTPASSSASDDEYEVATINQFRDRICIIATPYRGYDVAFLLHTPTGL